MKKRLDALHYCQPLSIDSAPLAEKLLTDLLKTTEGFQQLKHANTDLSKQLRAAQEAKAPLESEVARLHTGSNELHLSLMKVKEDTDKKDAQWRAAVKKMETENADLRFLVEQGKDVQQQLEQQTN